MEFIEHKLNQLSNNPFDNKSIDIHEHLYTLSNYASKCESVFETGVRGCISSWAFVHGLLHNNSVNKKILMNDIHVCNIDELLKVTKELPIIVQYEWNNNLNLNFTENYDLTFIDTWHIYGQLKRELAKFAPITNKYIIMHDTTIDEWNGEVMRYGCNDEKLSFISSQTGFPVDEINKGLWPAIQEFLDLNPEWILHERFINNNGLTILRRI
jgi:hypothetical protein